jgi:hypothetical protein
VDGIPESLIGSQCEAIVVEGYWHQRAVAEPANVIWLRFRSEWYRLFFDVGSVFWGKSNDPPKAYEMPELDADVRTVDLTNEFGLVDDELTSNVIVLNPDVAAEFNTSEAVNRALRDQLRQRAAGDA